MKLPAIHRLIAELRAAQIPDEILERIAFRAGRGSSATKGNIYIGDAAKELPKEYWTARYGKRNRVPGLQTVSHELNHAFGPWQPRTLTDRHMQLQREALDLVLARNPRPDLNTIFTVNRALDHDLRANEISADAAARIAGLESDARRTGQLLLGDDRWRQEMALADANASRPQVLMEMLPALTKALQGWQAP